MNNALIIQLQEAVNDNSLRKLGELRFVSKYVSNPPSDQYDSGKGRRIIINTNAVKAITCLDGGEFVNSSGTLQGTTKNISADVQSTLIFLNGIHDGESGGQPVISAGDFQISIPNKQTLTYLKMEKYISLNFSELYGCSALVALESVSEDTVGDIASIKELPITGLNLSYSGIYGNIQDTPLTGVDVYFRGTAIQGSIESLSLHRSLATINVVDTAIEGSIEALALGQWDNGNGRTSGTLLVQATRARTTFGGVLFTGNKTITFHDDGAPTYS